MKRDNTLVRDYMRLSPVFVYENDTLFNALEAMKKFKVDSITIIKDDFSIIGYIERKKIIESLELNNQSSINLLKDISVSDIIRKNEFPVILYPRMTAEDAYSTMKCFNVSGLPVADLPWEKKIIGFLWLDDIAPAVEKNYLKVSV